MLNKLERFLKRYEMLQPGDHVICAVSGGADSVALLFAMYLLAPKLQITVAAAHFNHGLRGEESDRDEAFVKVFCQRFEINLHMGKGKILPGKKGLEAAARDARYTFLNSLSGKIATAHTADDNAETVLMHMVRGSGLKGLGAIAPVNGRIIRPMLSVTRQDVCDFLREYHLEYVDDSSNATDQFLRNRLRHNVMPLLKQENPRLAENVSAMALRLREDELLISQLVAVEDKPDVRKLRQMPQALRSRVLDAFLQHCGVPEPEAEHIMQAENLVFSEKPSARMCFPGGVVIARNYTYLEQQKQDVFLEETILPCPGSISLPQLGIRVVCQPADGLWDEIDRFTIIPEGEIRIRPRCAGDEMRLHSGTKSLKKLFIDRKISAMRRLAIPVFADDRGVLGVAEIGANKARLASGLPGVEIRIENI